MSIRKLEEEKKKMPPGTRLLSEEERLKTLKSLEEAKAEARVALDKLPLSMRTLSLAKRKENLENKVDELEKAIKSFSREKVYIALD